MGAEILTQEFWKTRLDEAISKGQTHQAIYRCVDSHWRAITARHRQLLASLIQPTDSILDVGCGWGRLLSLLPDGWQGTYLGIDISGDFIRMVPRGAVLPDRIQFLQGNILDVDLSGRKFDWAVFISIRPMILNHLGQEYWDKINNKAATYCHKLLFLEYEPNDEGSVEPGLCSPPNTPQEQNSVD